MSERASEHGARGRLKRARALFRRVRRAAASFRRVLLIAALFLTLLPSAARAQSREGLDPDISVEFGYEGALVLGRWIPLTIWVQGGAEPFEGTLVVSYPQAERQAVVTERRIAATPGRRTPVHMVVRPGAACDRITVVLEDSRGRVVRRRSYVQFPSSRELQLPFQPHQSDLILLGIAARDEDLSSMRWIADANLGKSAAGLAEVSRPVLQPGDLPMAWMAYDGVLAVVADGASARQADPRSLAALREWVAAGGRLVIVASDPGGDAPGEGGWRDWLPPGPQGDLVRLAPVQQVTLPDEVMQVAAAEAPKAITRLDQAVASGVLDPDTEDDGEHGDAKPDDERPASDADDPDAPGLTAPRRTGRPIYLTQAGVQSGWRQRWLLDRQGSSPDGSGGDASASLLAEGPVGFGWVVVLSMDPRTATPQASGEQMIAVWADALRVAIGDFLDVAARFGGGGMGAPVAGSGYTMGGVASAAAINASLNEVADVPTPGAWAFVFVLVGGIILALLIGPVDAISLRRLRLRHRSWLTALAWIALASLVAQFLPRLVRSGDTILTRLECVDVLDPGPDAHEALRVAFSSGLTGVFSGRTQEAELSDGRADAFWSGFAPIRNGYESSPRRSGVFTIPFAQTGPALTTASPEDAWGGFLPGDGIDAEPRRMRLNLWTFHTLSDQARLEPPVSAEVRNFAGEWSVSLTAPPAMVPRAGAWLRLRDGWHSVSFSRQEDAGPWIGSVGAASPPPDQWRANWSPLDPQNYWSIYNELFQPRHALSIPGPDRRAMAVQALVESGRWAALYTRATLPDEPMTEDSDGVHLPGAIRRTTVIHRIVVPLPEGVRSLDPEVGPPPPS